MAILLIDDDELEAVLFRRSLARLDYSGELHVRSYAKDAIEFLCTSASENVRLILCDLRLPGVSGFQVADEFLRLPPERRRGKRLCVVTGSINPRDALRSRRHPAISDFLEKPLEFGPLKTVLREVGLLSDQGVTKAQSAAFCGKSRA